jgi:glucose-6-phosphate isomerase
VNVGQTPVKALGTTDQHSQVQLYVEGPYDKVVHFIGVEDYGQVLEIPASATGHEALDYLGGHTFNELIKAEQEATALALAGAGRPNCTHTLSEISPRTVGELLYTLEMATAYSGELYDIDAFDQPGVEAGKVATYALLGRRGYESKREEIERARAGSIPRYVIV